MYVSPLGREEFMKIWVDGDACPLVVKEIVFKAAERTKTACIFVANRQFRIPRSRYIHFSKVPSGSDVADNEIVKSVTSQDIVITSDIPLAARIIEKGAIGLTPRGVVYTSENIRERLSTRNFLETLRSSGIETGGPAALKKRDRQLFANSLDKLIQKYK